MQVIVTPNALKQYNHLVIKDQVKVKKKLLSLEQDPFSGKKLSGSFSDVRSLRVWPYRILYTIDTKMSKIFIVTIAHRQGVYK